MSIGAAYEDRRTQVDLRVTRTFRVAGAGSLQATADLYNVFNASTVLGRNDTYGPRWGQPTSILPGRMLQIGGRLTF
jgi:hypothetical protein